MALSGSRSSGVWNNDERTARSQTRSWKSLRFEENFKHRRAAVSFPRPLMDYTRHDLLIEEYQYAVPLNAFLRYGGGPFDRNIGTMGLDAFLVRL